MTSDSLSTAFDEFKAKAEILLKKANPQAFEECPSAAVNLATAIGLRYSSLMRAYTSPNATPNSALPVCGAAKQLL